MSGSKKWLNVLQEWRARFTHYLTRRNRAEKALRESEARFRRLAENAPDIIYRSRLAPTYGFDYISPAITDIIGYTPEEYYADPGLIFRVLHPDDRPWIESLVESFAQSPPSSVPPINTRWIRKDGAVIWTEHRLTIVHDVENGIVAAEGIMRDITERVRAVEALRESEERFRQLVENLQDALILYDTKASKMLYANPYTAEILGVPLEKLLTHDSAEILRRFIHPEDRQRLRSALAQSARARKEGKPGISNLEFRICRPDGQIRWLYQCSYPAQAKDAPSSLVYTILSDITERKRLEEQFRQSQKMEAVGRLAAGVAHEFNNLLTIIMGYVSLAAAELPAGGTVRQDFEQVRKAGEQATSLVRQLLAFSRRQALQSRVLDLNEVVRHLEKMLQRLIGEDVELATALAPDLWQVKTDPGQIEQVLMNLVLNALDAMPRGGRVTLETANAMLSKAYVRAHLKIQPGPYVMLAVSDTGVGMDRETQARIFEPFFTTKPVGEGTGLGLATVYGIVIQSNGHISVDSEPGRGTTFKIYLPRVNKAVETVERAPALPVETPRETETLLVVEDEMAVRHMMRRALRQRGYTVLETSAPVEAIRLCKQHAGHISLLITDIVMPEMTGIDLAERLAKLRPEIKTLYISGYPTQAIAHHGVLKPGVIFLQKPFTPDTLAQKVREVLNTAQKTNPLQGNVQAADPHRARF